MTRKSAKVLRDFGPKTGLFYTDVIGRVFQRSTVVFKLVELDTAVSSVYSVGCVWYIILSMQITKKIFRISCIIPCLLCIAISFAQEIDKFSCNFEVPNSCQWTQDASDDFNWTRHQGRTESPLTGPLADHTKGLASGWYLYIETSSPREPCDTARLNSPSTTKAKSRLLFFYHMYGADVRELRVYVKSGGKMDSLWSLSGDQGDKWYQAQVAVNNQTASYQFVIEGVRGKDLKGDIAIDDITLMDSYSGREIDKFSCNFEVPNSCQWAQDSSDDFNWTRHQGGTPSVNTGPSTDHTRSSVSDWYLYIKASSPRQPNDTARLISPSTTQAKSCLLFFYHMYGNHIGKLRVYVKSGGKMDSLWSLSGDQGNGWFHERVAVNNQTASYQFVIEGVRGNGWRGDIAIDDISVMDSCPPRDKFSCDFEDPNSCEWTQDKSDDFDWTRNQASTPTQRSGPTTDHTKGSVTNKTKGPGSIRHSGGKCIHALWRLYIYTRPKEGDFLVTYPGCGKDRLEFQLWPNGTLMLTKYGMCVKPTGPVTEGVKVGVFISCNATDTWSWTAQGSLQYKKKMCLKPETGGENPKANEKLVLDSVCDEQQSFFMFVATSGWYLYMEASSPRRPNDKARLISPSTTETKSRLLFFYHMYGRHVGKLRVYVKSGDKMGLPVWSLSGEQGNKWHQAQVAVNDQTASYQYVIEGVRGKSYEGDIAIDDISVILMVSGPPRENQPTVKSTSKKVTTTITVSTTPAISPSQTSSEDKGRTDDSSRIIIIATTLGAGVFLSIVLIILLMKYKRRKRAPKLSTPVNIPLEANEISPEPLPVEEEAVHETVPNVDRKFYEDVATNANKSEEISTEGRKSDHEEVEVPSNAHKASGHTELNKRPDTLKRGAIGDGDYQTFLKQDDGYVIPAPKEPQHETPCQNETCEEPKLSPGCEELDQSKLESEME